MEPMLPESAEATERAFSTLFEESVRMHAYRFWQSASRRQQKKYPQYAMPEKEYQRRYRQYQSRVAENDALSLNATFDLLEAAIPLMNTEGSAYLDTQVAGENLKTISMFLCCLGEEACPGDLELFLRDVWDPESTREERRRIRSYEGRAELLLLLNLLLAQASEEIVKLGVERGVSQLRYYCFDADDDFELDTDVLGTNYLGLRSLTQYAEGAAGHA